MNVVFADTFYFVGLTTDWILVEYADAMSATRHRSAVGRYIQELPGRPNVVFVPFSRTLFDQGLALYISRADKDWSLTDCISFVIMRERGLADALMGDHHFEQAGFNALLK